MFKRLISAGFLSFVSIFCLFFIGSTSASAATGDSNHIHTQEELNNPDYLEVTPKYVACPEGGKHHMVGAGNGWVWSPKKKDYLLTKGQASRCSKCGLVIVSQYNPFAGHQLLGYFATGNGATNPNGNVLYADALSYNSKLGGDTFTQSLSWGR